MKRGHLLVTLAGVAFLATAAAIYLSLRRAEVEVVTIETRDVRRTLVVVGRVRPTSVAELGSIVGGVVREVNVREGGRVERGNVVVRLDNQEARAAVAQAEARLVEVAAQASDEIRRAQIELEQANRDVDRIRSVLAEGALTQQRLEQAEQRVSEAESRLAAVQGRSGASGPSAAVLGARAALDGARTRLAQTGVEAPYDGTVLQRLVEPGDVVQPGRTLITVSADGPLEVVIFPSEENLARLTPDARAVVSADAYPDETFAARVALVAPVIDPAQGTVEVRLAIDDPPAYLRPGMTLSVNLEVGSLDGAAVLPSEAVRGLGTSDPWVALIRDGRIERRSVTVGLRGDGFVEISDGLLHDEPVARWSQGLEPGDRVRTAP